MSKLQTIRDTFLLFGQWLHLECGHLIPRKTYAPHLNHHLALFAWALPPNSNAGVYRPLSFIRYGSKLGWHIDAFRGEVPNNQSEHGEELLRCVPNNARLHGIPSSSLAPAYRFSPKIDGGFANAIAYAKFAINLLSSDPPDIVLASGPPFHVFVSAFLVSKWFKTPLVLDYRDEWTECPFDFVSVGKHDLFWEKRCLSAAAAVFFTTESHLKHQLRKFPELSRNKAHLISNGWEPGDFEKIDTVIPSKQEKRDSKIFTLAHIGNLAGHNPPHDFLDALAELLTEEPGWRQRLKVSFIGRRSSAAMAALKAFPYMENLEMIDHVSKRESNRRMQEADALLLLASPALERYLPGKLFDYIAAGRPVLVFGYPGEASALIDSLNVGVLCHPGSGTLLGQALNLLSNMNKRSDTVSTMEWLNEHKRENLAKKAFDIFETLHSKTFHSLP